ncbi:MAG: hypothetical protein GMKNLPBB_02459 [Myxococcota bacterium]|nr:hypothetical protein [Myxococcota bacterium]
MWTMLLLLAPAAAECGEGAVIEAWYRLLIHDQHAGLVHEWFDLNPPGEIAACHRVVEIKIRRGDETVRRVEEQHATVDRNGENHVYQIAVRENGRMIEEIPRPGDRILEELRRHPPSLSPRAIPLRGPLPRIPANCLNWMLGQARQSKSWSALGEDIQGRRLINLHFSRRAGGPRIHWEGSEGDVEVRLQYDPGQPLAGRIDLPSLGWRLEQSGPIEAQAYSRLPGASPPSPWPVIEWKPVIRGAGELRAMNVRLTIPREYHHGFPTGPLQELSPVRNGLFQVRVVSVSAAASATPSAGAAIAVVERWLRPQVAEELPIRKKIAAVVSLVHRALPKKSSSHTHLPPEKALEFGEGDCSEHAALAEAAFRVLHIPARAVFGVMADDKGVFTGHAWVEVHDGERWSIADPTHDQWPGHAGRIMLGIGPTPASRDWGRLRAMGTVRFEVTEILRE